MSSSVSVESFFAAVENRRTYYNLSNESPVSDAEIQAIVERAIKHAPTSFNMQQTRAIVLTGKNHHALWESVTETYLKTLPNDGGLSLLPSPSSYPSSPPCFKRKECSLVEARNGSAAKIQKEYAAGYGTVVFFEDTAVLEGWSAKMPPLKECFSLWSDNAAGILQYIVWTSLEAVGFGASLQHYGSYSPETDVKVRELFNLPSTWKSTAMMPFGKPTGPPGRGEKQFAPVEDRVKTFFA